MTSQPDRDKPDTGAQGGGHHGTAAEHRQATPLPDWTRLPELEPLWRAGFRALYRNGRTLPRSLTVRGMSDGTRREVGALMGRMLLDPDVRIDAAELDALLRTRCGAGLLTVVESLLGPVADRAAEAAARARRRRGPLQQAVATIKSEDLAGGTDGWLVEWADGIDRAGLVVRHSLTGDDLVRSLRAAAAAGPTAPTSRVQLAANHFGDAHALDPGSVRESLTLRAVAARLGLAVPRTASERRDLWEQAGVLPDQLSSTCLLLGLRCAADGAAARRLALAADAGDPVHVTAWDLARLPPFDPPPAVFVCENPRVLEAVADRFGPRVPAVCVAGQPGLVTMSVLRGLASAGSELTYHGDFDWPGIAIANRLVQSYGVRPWAMDAADYRAGAARTPLALSGDAVDPLWDRELGPAMREVGRAVHQEVVLDRILERLPGR